MQDFDTLRHRVEETAERLSLAQSERHEETQSLIAILRDLEEKYSAQEQQFTYYRARLEPLERSNTQLTALIENLLDLIDRGFGESSLFPLRKASEMASAMLKAEIGALNDISQAQDGMPDGEAAFDVTGHMDGEADALSEAEPDMAALEDVDGADGEADAVISEAEPDMAALDDADEADTQAEAVISEAEPGMATLDDADGADTQADAAISEAEPDMATLDDADGADTQAEAAISEAEPDMATLDDADEADTQADAISEAEPDMAAHDGEIQAVGEVEEDEQVIRDLVELVDESPEIASHDPVAADEEDPAVTGEDASADEQDESQFGGVADLELEEVPLSNLEEDIDAASDIDGADIDAIAAMDLSDPITSDASATAVAANNETPQAEDPGPTIRFEDVSGAVLELELTEDAAAGFDDLPEIVKTAAAAFASGGSVDEADSIAALTLAMEEESRSDNAPPPAKSDIRSLMLRVEALAKKAEAMRLAQGEDTEMLEAGDGAADGQATAKMAIEPDDKKSAVA